MTIMTDIYSEGTLRRCDGVTLMMFRCPLLRGADWLEHGRRKAWNVNYVWSMAVAPGMICIAVDDYSPLRLGPENGSQVLFFLNRKDEIVISKVAGSRLYGRTRVYLSDKGLYQNIFGWVQAEDVAFKNK